MRFAIVRQDYHPDGAVERAIERALEALLERNVAVSLYTRSWPQMRLQLIEPVICNPFHIGRGWRERSFATAACRSIRRTLPNLVEAHAPMLCCDIYRAGDGVHAERLEQLLQHASATQRLRLACSAYHRYRLRIEERLFASGWLRKVICKSAMVRDEIHARFAVPESKLAVIYNAVDAERFHPGLRADRLKVLERYRVAASATIFITVCRDFDHDCAATVIDAIAQLPPPAHLVVVATPRCARRVRARARKRGIDARVTTVDSHVDVRPHYGAADVFVAPSRYDPCPDAPLEAMACALPVIGSTKSGVAELLTEHECGVVCPPRDAAALAAHMRSLLDGSMRTRLGDNARRAVLPLSSAATTLSLVLLYRDLLASGAPRVARNTATSGA